MPALLFSGRAVAVMRMQPLRRCSAIARPSSGPRAARRHLPRGALAAPNGRAAAAHPRRATFLDHPAAVSVQGPTFRPTVRMGASMPGTDKRKQSLYFPEDMLNEIQAEANRQDRSLSWIVQQAWRIARGEIMRFPSVNDVLSGVAREDEREEKGG